MCVTTLAAASLALGALGTGVQVIGALNKGQAQTANYNYEAQVARNNAIIAQQNADRAAAAGRAQAEATSQKGAAEVARIKAAQAASGIDVNTGSSTDVQASARSLNQLDTETVLNNAQVQAYGYRSQAQNFRSQADLYAMGGRAAQTASLLEAGGGLLSNASALGFKWGSMAGTGSGGNIDNEIANWSTYGSGGTAADASAAITGGIV